MVKKFFKLLELGVPLSHYKGFHNRNVTGTYKTKLLKKELLINNPYWYLHSLEELFIDEVYKFYTDNSIPYIIDCGANVGLSIIYFKKNFPSCKILAFEPDKEIFSLLSKNVNIRQYSDVELINAAVWTKNTVLSFSSDGALGGSLSELGINTKSTFSVQAVDFSYILGQKPVDFLKLDIEGAEFEVLNKCRDSLKNVQTMFVEYHSAPSLSQMLPELLEIIKGAGFRIYVKEAWSNMDHPFLDYRSNYYYDLQLNIFCYR